MKRGFVIALAVGLAAVAAVGWWWLRRAPMKVEEPQVAKIGPAWQDPQNPIAQLFKGKRLDLWSLRPIQNPEAPATDSKWPRGEVDRFILAKLQSEELTPAPEADRRILARRLYFDLTGLPPTYEQVEEFANDKDRDAYENLVERLLGSREFGEHWARWWLDVVRYSDSNGYDWDEFRPQAWRFRDYVIRSLNDDKPMDLFIREQLSGDEMVKGTPHSAYDQDCYIATSYLHIGPHDHSAEKFGEERRERAHMTADLVETTGAAFLGLTLNCARCHDHKTDPISQADHYRMRAFFDNVIYRDEMPLDLPDQQDAIRQYNTRFDGELKAANDAVAEVLAPARARYGGTKKLKAPIPDDMAIKHATPEEKDAYDAAHKKVLEVKGRMQPYTMALCVTDDAEDLNPVSHILNLGDPDQPKGEVTPGFLSVLNPNPITLDKPVNPGTSGRRTTLANWILSKDNPLTARVMANRIWQGVFGHGIVATPNDFGYSGSRPTHPELLDWLATKLEKSQWSLKSMIRLLVNSATYRESSTHPQLEMAMGKDADNRLLWRHDLRRLTAEELRDAMLVVAGLMQTRSGGPPVWPELPVDVAQASPSLLKEAENEEKTKGWYPSPPEQTHVRSIYLVQKRTVRLPFMETFDLPDNFTTCAMRNVSTVAPQALTLLNGPFVIEASHAFAKRLEAGPANATAKQQVDLAFRMALQHEAPGADAKIARHVVDAGGLTELARLVFNLDEFIYVD